MFHDVVCMVLFVYQQELSWTDHLAQLGALESDVVPEGTGGSVGWSCALSSAQRTDSG